MDVDIRKMVEDEVLGLDLVFGMWNDNGDREHEIEVTIPPHHPDEEPDVCVLYVQTAREYGITAYRYAMEGYDGNTWRFEDETWESGDWTLDYNQAVRELTERATELKTPQ